MAKVLELTTEQEEPQPMTASPAVNDRLGALLLSLEKVDGALATILDVGSEESMNQPSPKQLLSMLQLLADVESPACEELEAIMRRSTPNSTSTISATPSPRGCRISVSHSKCERRCWDIDCAAARPISSAALR